MRERKVAFSHYSAPNDVGGVTTWLERLLVRLKRDGYQIVVLLHHLGSDASEASILRPLLDAGIEVECRLRSQTLVEDIYDTLAFLNRHRPMVFLPQCLSAMYLAAAIAGRQGLPWVMVVHSDGPEYWAIAKLARPEDSGGRVVGVSDYILQSVVERGLASRPEIIPCGVPLSSRLAIFSDAPFRVAFTGRLVEEPKRISLVVATMVEACRGDSRICGLVLGEGEARATAMRLVDELGLTDRIRFPGRLPPAEIQAELAQCQAILLMSDFEGLPVSLLEAMAVGVVPVARKIQSGVPELVHDGETGLLVNDRPEDAATAILRLVDDPALWNQCSRHARQLVESRFGEDECYLKWVALLNDICQRSNARYPIVMSTKPRFERIPPLLVNYYPRPVSFTQQFQRKLAGVVRTTKRFVRGR